MNAVGIVKTAKLAASGLAVVCAMSACATSAGNSIADSINPYAADESQGLGQRNTSALTGGGGGGQSAEDARKALENLSKYQRASAPQPVYPVMRPAEARLMWIPDHLTLDGNLVPAHYYFLKVTNDVWQVQDAFEVEGQFDNISNGGGDYGAGGAAPIGGGAGYGGATPWVYKEGK